MRRYMLPSLILFCMIPLFALAGEATSPGDPRGFGVFVSVDQPEYFTRLTPIEPPTIHLQIRVFNGSEQPVTLEVGGQRFDFEIHDAEGQLVWRWSDGKFFIQILELLTLAPGEDLTFRAAHRFIDSRGEALAEGRYTVTGKLVSTSAVVEGKVSFTHLHRS